MSVMGRNNARLEEVHLDSKGKAGRLGLRGACATDAPD